MKKFLFAILFVLGLTANANALSLQWDAVRTDTQGVVLGAGMEVTSYKVWKCTSPTASCLKAGATVIGTVAVPLTDPNTLSISITTQPVPSTYFVTAVNIINESAESASLKATGADKPKGLVFIQP
jgi:hypothetical protein